MINSDLNSIKTEERGMIAPCGVICLGCDFYIGDCVEAAKRVQEIWEGWNMIDIGPTLGFNAKNIKITLKTLKLFINRNKNTCPGCHNGGKGTKVCGIAQCVFSKGYWTCAECEDFNPESETPCPHINQDAPYITDKGKMMKLMCARYSKDLNENLKKIREIGYSEFLKEIREKVTNGWRTWQIINKGMVFTNKEKK
ncbi:MAG: DUF3795 domain-containing protein [Promethearchaeota archaeon]